MCVCGGRLQWEPRGCATRPGVGRLQWEPRGCATPPGLGGCSGSHGAALLAPGSVRLDSRRSWGGGTEPEQRIQGPTMRSDKPILQHDPLSLADPLATTRMRSQRGLLLRVQHRGTEIKAHPARTKRASNAQKEQTAGPCVVRGGGALDPAGSAGPQLGGPGPPPAGRRMGRGPPYIRRPRGWSA